MGRRGKFQIGVVTILFLLSVIWYFFPVGKECFDTNLFRMRLALPAAVLALGSIGLLPGLMSSGFVFCTIGDAMGVLGSFEGQMGGFAVAQICFIVQFVKDIRQNLKGGTLSGTRSMGAVTATMVCLLPLLIAAWNILPEVKPLPIRIGCGVYALLLLSSVWTSIVRAFVVKRYVAMIGCVIFLISDFTIAWNKFTEHIPHAGLYIMTTYYTALILIFCGTKSEK